jgi:hypothetical protein
VTFSFAAAKMDWAGRFLELKAIMAMAMGLASARGRRAKGTARLNANLVPAFWRVGANPFKLFHHRFALKQKWNSDNV